VETVSEKMSDDRLIGMKRRKKGLGFERRSGCGGGAEKKKKIAICETSEISVLTFSILPSGCSECSAVVGLRVARRRCYMYVPCERSVLLSCV
jgi:hypothetical protein